MKTICDIHEYIGFSRERRRNTERCEYTKVAVAGYERVKSLRKKHCAEMHTCCYCYHNFTSGSLSLLLAESLFSLLFLIP